MKRAIVIAPWSSLRGMRGEIVQTKPYLMMRLDGDDPRPVRVGETEIIPEEESAPNIGGAE